MPDIRPNQYPVQSPQYLVRLEIDPVRRERDVHEVLALSQALEGRGQVGPEQLNLIVLGNIGEWEWQLLKDSTASMLAAGGGKNNFRYFLSDHGRTIITLL